MNNFKTKVPKKYQKYSPSLAYILMDSENAPPDTEKDFQRRLTFLKKLICEHGIFT